MKRACEQEMEKEEDASLVPIPDLIRELELVKQAEEELARKKQKAIDNLYKSMRPVYILRGCYATRGTPYKHKVLGAFSTFAAAYAAKEESEKKGGLKMVVEAIAQVQLGKYPYDGCKLDGKLDTDGYVSP